MINRCSICQKEAELRHIPIYVTGSREDGVNICHECVLALADFIQILQRTCYHSRVLGMSTMKELKDKQIAFMHQESRSEERRVGKEC